MARNDDAMQANYRPELAVGVYDYRAIGTHADIVRVMSYDQHYPTGKPGSVAAYGWVESVVRYTVARVPAHKVEMGLASYGRDWGKPGVRAEAFTTRQAASRMRAVGATRQWSDTHRSPYFTYRRNGVRHTAWYEDARSNRARARLARKYGLAGVAIWTTGGADTATWQALTNVAHHR